MAICTLREFSIITTCLFSICMLGCKEQRTGPTEIQCPHRLKQIGFALESYHATYGAYPPAVVRDDHGEPMHSWRVLILPFLGESELYDDYDLSEPWHSQHNRRLLDRVPTAFKCPKVQQLGYTPFTAVVGSDAAWSHSGYYSKSDFQDGIDNTIFVIELDDDAVRWTEPIDLEVSIDGPMRDQKDADNIPKPVNVLFGNGAVFSVEWKQLFGPLKATLTRKSADKFDRGLLGEVMEH